MWRAERLSFFSTALYILVKPTLHILHALSISPARERICFLVKPTSRRAHTSPNRLNKAKM